MLMSISSIAQTSQPGTFDITAEALDNVNGVFQGPCFVKGSLDDGTNINTAANIEILPSITSPIMVDYVLNLKGEPKAAIRINDVLDQPEPGKGIKMIGVSGIYNKAAERTSPDSK